MVYEQDLRERLAKIGKILHNEGLAVGTTGNVSVRLPDEDLCIIKPSGFRLSEIKPADFIVVNIKTRKVIDGNRKPSIETPFHTTLYEIRKDVGSVVHVHAHYATVLTLLDISVKSYTTDICEAPDLACGIGIAEFAPPGTEKLAANLGEALRECYATVMPHHGITTIGNTPERAMKNAIVLERMARIQYHALLLGQPKQISDKLV